MRAGAARMGWKRANQPLSRGHELAGSLRQAVVVLPILIATTVLVLHKMDRCAAQHRGEGGARGSILRGTIITASQQVSGCPASRRLQVMPEHRMPQGIDRSTALARCRQNQEPSGLQPRDALYPGQVRVVAVDLLLALGQHQSSIVGVSKADTLVAVQVEGLL